eukprot:6181065-Pleurochrysis_carterae.AAC.1
MMGDAATFTDEAALSKLAALYPAIETSPADGPSGAGHGRTANKRTTEGTGASLSAGRLGSAFDMKADPSWLKTRLSLLEQIKERNAATAAATPKPPIKI